MLHEKTINIYLIIKHIFIYIFRIHCNLIYTEWEIQ